MKNETEIQRSIGKRIQQIRKSKGYTQLQFSEMVDISPNYLSEIERGKSSPRIDKLVAIINTLDCSADDIFQGVTNCGYKITSSQLSERIKDLSSEEQKKIFAVLDVLIGNEK